MRKRVSYPEVSKSRILGDIDLITTPHLPGNQRHLYVLFLSGRWMFFNLLYYIFTKK